MLYEFVEALIHAGLPVALLSFALMYWSLHRGLLTETGSMKALKRELKQLGKNKKERAKTADPLHNKWMKFGGGFYGVLAMLTLIVIEWSDIKQVSVSGFQAIIDDIGIGLVIELLIESFTNFITAMIWPLYWMDEIDTDRIWLWFIAAYAGYFGGTHLARYQAQVRKEENLD